MSQIYFCVLVHMGGCRFCAYRKIKKKKQNINKQILTNMAKNDILKRTNVFVPRIYGYKKRDEAHRKR